VEVREGPTVGGARKMNRVKQSLEENKNANPQIVVEAFADFLTEHPEMEISSEELLEFVSQ
jgi:hypothetical protein